MIFGKGGSDVPACGWQVSMLLLPSAETTQVEAEDMIPNAYAYTYTVLYDLSIL